MKEAKEQYMVSNISQLWYIEYRIGFWGILYIINPIYVLILLILTVDIGGIDTKNQYQYGYKYFKPME